MTDAVRHAGQIGVEGNGHDFGLIGAFFVQAVEMIHRSRIQHLGWMVLQRHHHDVMDFKVVGQRDDRLAGGAQGDRFVVKHPVTDVLDPGRCQMINRVVGLGQAGPEPAARALARKPGDDVDRLADDFLLMVDLMHRHLVVTVDVEFPAAGQTCLDHLRISLAHPGVESDGGRDSELLEKLSQTPETNPHAVLVPGPVRRVRQHRLPLRRRNHHPCHRPGDIPLLQGQHRPQNHACIVGQGKRCTLGDRRKIQSFPGQHA